MCVCVCDEHCLKYLESCAFLLAHDKTNAAALLLTYSSKHSDGFVETAIKINSTASQSLPYYATNELLVV